MEDVLDLEGENVVVDATQEEIWCGHEEEEQDVEARYEDGYGDEYGWRLRAGPEE